MRFNKKSPVKPDKKAPPKAHKKGVVGYNKKTALLEEAITHMNEGKYGRSSAALKELLALDPLNTEARRLFATLHLRLGSLISARTAFESLAREALERQDFWLAESLLREYLTAGPRCVPFLDMLGQVYEQKGDSMAAVAEYGKAIEVLIEDPDSDHPDRAADLFAKIRSLAAGSSEAFRFASLFDSATGKLLSPPPVSNPNPPIEDAPPTTELIATAGESSPILVEAPQASPGHTTEPEAPAAPAVPDSFMEQPNHNAPVLVADAALPEISESQGTEAGEDPTDEKSVSAAQQGLEVPPPVIPLSEAPDETPDAPLKLADELPAMPTRESTPDMEPTPLPTLDTIGSFETEPPPQAEETIAVPDLSLHEVTQPIIIEAPSTPVSMPWDQVQDTTISIPLPSVEPEATQTAGTETPNHTEDFSIPEPAATADDHPTLPVQPESQLSSMSWEDILAAVGKGPEIPPEAGPTTASVAAHEQADLNPSVSDHHAFDAKNPVLTPISEPVAEAQALPIPMPWEQVEEEVVPILRHEPEPEFGAVPENLLLAAIDDAGPSHSEERKSQTDDATLALGEAMATPPAEQEQTLLASSPLTLQETIQEPAVDPLVEQPLDQSTPPPPVDDETSAIPSIPSDPSTIDPTTIEPPPVDPTPDEPTVEIADQPASVTVDTPAALPAEPPAIASESEPVLSEQTPAEEARADVPESSDIETQSSDGADLEPAIPEALVVTPTSPESAAVLEEPVSPNPITKIEPPPAAHERATSGEIKILWDEQSSPSLQARTGLLSRLLRRPKLEEPVDSKPSEGPAPDIPSAGSEQTESFTPEPTTPAPFLPPSSGEKTAKVRIQKPPTGSLSSRMRFGAARLIGTCFTTTRSIIVSSVVLVSAVLGSGLAAAGLAALVWVLMEERPNTAFHNLNVMPLRTLQEATTNGYLVLLGFDRGANQDAAQAGFARKFGKSDLAMTGACLMSSEEQRGGGRPDGEGMLAGWYLDPDPAARFRAQAASVRTMVSQAGRSMARYKQWLAMPFEDWGYGEAMSPNCPIILHAHRLYVADGFAQDIESGIDRLLADLAMWRHVMSHAKSLSIKMLAVGAVNDDVTIVSGLLPRPDFDDRLLGRLAKSARPLDQVEQSLRWPMQGELKAAVKIQETLLKPDSGETPPLYAQLVSMMPLPTQRRLNLYADYYEASGKAAAEGRFAGLPKRAGFVRYPVESWLDYGLNPIENILSVPPLPEWENYGGRILELDAKLRLASLQAWIRRSPQEQDIPTRMAKAGQALYDPFTGFPMLVNRSKGLIYSVGQDGKDHDGRPGFDIAAVIPSQPGGLPTDGKRSTSPAKTRQ